MVHKLYKPYACPLVRAVHGFPISWEPIVAAVEHDDYIGNAAWSPCSKFIAVGLFTRIEIRDAVTLERLHAFAHPQEVDHQWLSFSPDSRSLTHFSHSGHGITTWDLQTGGRISIIPSTPNRFLQWYSSSAYSMDGNVVAVAHSDPENRVNTVISTYNLLSGTHIYSHCVWEEHVGAPIWTHGEYLRFVTVKPRSIVIWEVGFTSKHALAEVKSLPAPEDVGSEEFRFLPTLSRLAFILGGAVLVWDARDSKFLLNFVGGNRPRGLSFSSDGRFFACGSTIRETHLWKESRTGYVLHRKFDSGIAPLLSPDGESVITSSGLQTQLSRTTDPINPPSGVPTQPADRAGFAVAFSPDRSLIATGRLGDNITTILDLKSGDPRLIVDAGVKICGLGVTANTVIVVGEGKIVTWNLPAGDCVPDAAANIHDSVRTIVFNHPPPPPEWLHSASISPDFNHLVITRGGGKGLDIYDTSTGKHVVGSAAKDVSHPWFTQDGREVWYRRGLSQGETIIRGEGSDFIGLKPRFQWYATPSGGHLWKSLRGHEIADDGWILDSREKRVMWLPHHWRVHQKYRIWDGRFLVLFDPRLPEPIVIELDE